MLAHYSLDNWSEILKASFLPFFYAGDRDGDPIKFLPKRCNDFMLTISQAMIHQHGDEKLVFLYIPHRSYLHAPRPYSKVVSHTIVT